MGLSRREFLVGAAAACATLRAMTAANAQGAPAPPYVDMSEPLGKHAAAKGVLFGTALRFEALKDPAYADLVVSQCNIGVPEGALKWDVLRPAPDRYDFGAADYYYRILSSHAMKYRGHTLVWDQALPPWFKTIVNTGNAKAMMLEHISTVVGHYAGKMHSWDVVNEAIKPQDGRPDGLKNTPWLQMIGPEYIEMAFHAAHEADPKVMLVYNENSLEPEDQWREEKRKATLRLLTDMKRKGVPVHGLGIQSHLLPETVVNGPHYARFLDQVAELGLVILITEMDVSDQHLVGSVESRDRVVAKIYYEYLTFMLQRKAVKAVLTWGLSSRYTWLSQANPRPDGSSVRPLPYDADLRPTPAWEAVAAAFDQARGR